MTSDARFDRQLEPYMARLRSNPRPVIVEVWATWCMPCRQMAPALERVREEYDGRVDLWKLDAGRDPELARALNVLGVPTMIVYGQDHELARRIGAQSEDGIRALFAAAESGQAPVKTGLPGRERHFRLAAAAAVAIAGFLSGPSLSRFWPSRRWSLSAGFTSAALSGARWLHGSPASSAHGPKTPDRARAEAQFLHS